MRCESLRERLLRTASGLPARELARQLRQAVVDAVAASRRWCRALTHSGRLLDVLGERDGRLLWVDFASPALADGPAGSTGHRDPGTEELVRREVTATLRELNLTGRSDFPRLLSALGESVPPEDGATVEVLKAILIGH
jgi:hypothetical protein